jgi:hypothetical protein
MQVDRHRAAYCTKLLEINHYFTTRVFVSPAYLCLASCLSRIAARVVCAVGGAHVLHAVYIGIASRIVNNLHMSLPLQDVVICTYLGYVIRVVQA